MLSPKKSLSVAGSAFRYLSSVGYVLTTIGEQGRPLAVVCLDAARTSMQKQRIEISEVGASCVIECRNAQPPSVMWEMQPGHNDQTKPSALEAIRILWYRSRRAP
jgi:hypothetical protein